MSYVPLHPQVIFLINANSAWCVIIIDFLILLGGGYVKGWVYYSAAIYSAYYFFFSECLRVGVLNLCRVLGPFEVMMEMWILLPHLYQNVSLHFQGIHRPGEAHPHAPGEGGWPGQRTSHDWSTVCKKGKQPGQKKSFSVVARWGCTAREQDKGWRKNMTNADYIKRTVNIIRSSKWRTQNP